MRQTSTAPNRAIAITPNQTALSVLADGYTRGTCLAAAAISPCTRPRHAPCTTHQAPGARNVRVLAVSVDGGPALFQGSRGVGPRCLRDIQEVVGSVVPRDHDFLHVVRPPPANPTTTRKSRHGTDQGPHDFQHIKWIMVDEPS
jgi:hypothetical protein